MRATFDGIVPHLNATIEALTRELQSTIEALTWREVDAVSSDSGDVVLLAAAEQEIINCKAWCRALFEASPLPTLVHDADSGQIMTVNPATIDQYGYTRDELLSMKIDELRSTGERDHIARILAQAEIAGRATGTWSHRQKNGAFISVEVVAQQVQFNGRRAWLTICTDVTRRLAQQHALRASEESLKTMLNSIGDAVIATDEKGRIVRMHPVSESLTEVRMVGNLSDWDALRRVLLATGTTS